MAGFHPFGLGASAARSSPGPDSRGIAKLEGEAHGLTDRLPDLIVEALRVSSTIAHGLHGRRRAGPGETFWQFRPFEQFDSAGLIDWRRSAGSDHLYVREREWEAAHTFWLWPDISASMEFKSHLAHVTKRDRALVIFLAAAELLVRAGERVALLGLTKPTASRKATTRLSEAIALNAGLPVLTASLPPPVRLTRFSGVVLVSDFLDPEAEVIARLEALAAGGVTGHLIQVLDPAEETLPYEGRAEFLGLEGGERWIADRAESLRAAYVARLEAHRAAIAAAARRIGWTMLVHHTDRPATEPLLALIMRLQNGGRGVMASQRAGFGGMA
ncbi:MAG: DUF58 domain-containing protein [Hyphomicrobiaceae bacterium]